MLKLLLFFLFVSIAFAENETFYRERPDVLKASSSKIESTEKFSVGVWDEIKRALPETIAFYLEAYPDHDLYFLGRDGEYLYDFSRAILSESERKKVHLINVSRANVDDPHIRDYLDQQGISERHFQKGKKIVLIDTGYYGTMIEKIARLFPEIPESQIKKHLVLSEKKTIPSTKVFFKYLDPWSAYKESQQMHGKLNLIEHLPHQTKKSTSFDVFKGKWDAKAELAALEDQKLSGFIQGDIKAYADLKPTKVHFKTLRGQYSDVFKAYSQKDEKKLIDLLKAFDARGEKEFVSDFYELTKTEMIDASLFPYLDPEKRKKLIEKELQKNDEWKRILAAPDEEIPRVLSIKWVKSNKDYLEAALDQKEFREALLHHLGSKPTTTETQKIILALIDRSHIETMNDFPKFVFSNPKSFDEELSVLPIKRFLQLSSEDSLQRFVKFFIYTPQFGSLKDSVSILNEMKDKVDSFQKPIVLERIKELEAKSSLSEIHKIPTFRTEEEKLRWITHLKTKVPELVSSAGKYQVDLMEILDDQQKLQDKLNQKKNYVELSQKKTQSLLSMVIIPTAKAEVRSYEIAPKSLGEWKAMLKEELAKIDGGKVIDELREKIYLRSHELGKTSSDGIETGLILTLDPSLQKEAFRVERDKRLFYLQDALPEKISPKFKFDLYQLPTTATKWDVLTKLRTTLALEDELKKLVELYLILQKRDGSFYADPNLRLTYLKSFDFEVFVKTEELKSRLNLLSQDLKDFYGEKLSSNIDRVIHLDIKAYVKKIPVKVEKVIDGVRLSEVIPQEGIFRGCTGGDCSTMASFPYPNDPSERVFYIFDKNNKVKGYLTGSRVKIKDGYGFYVITIAGARISSADTQLILNGLHEAKDLLDVDKILLPPQDRLDKLINYSAIRSIFENSTMSEIIRIEYIHPEIRTAIESFPSMYSEEVHDKMSHNKISVEYKPLVNLQVQNTPKFLKHEFPQVDMKTYRQTVLELAMAYYQFSGDVIAYSRVLNALKMGVTEQEEFLSLVTNEAREPLASYRQTLMRLFDYDQAEVEKKMYDFPSGLLNCPDFTDSKSSAAMLKYIELKNDQFKQLPHRFSEEILKSKTLTRLMIEQGDEKVHLYFNYFIFSQPASSKFEDEFLLLLSKLSPRHHHVVIESVFSKPHSQNFQRALLYALEHANEKTLASFRTVINANDFWRREEFNEIVSLSKMSDKKARATKVNEFRQRLSLPGCAPWFKPLGEIR